MVVYLLEKKVVPVFVVSLLVVSALPGGLGLVLDKFSDGSAGVLLEFPQNGGADSNISVDLPRRVIVNSAAVDIEGRGKTYGPSSGLMDFSGPAGSTAFDGTIPRLPPAGNPNGFEGNNITLDGGLQKSDDRRTSTRAANSAPFQMFEFDLSEVSATDFDFMWEGLGTIYPASGSESSSGLLFIYNSVNVKWENIDSYDLGGPGKDDQLLWARMDSGAADYKDARGRVCLLVTVPQPMIGQYTGVMQTDYATFWYNGTRTLFPQNLTLDVSADGSTEWQRPGRLQGKTSFTGAGFVNALQAALDASSQEQVKIPLEFSSESGGILFVSNLSIDYDMNNLPPEVNGTIPKPEMDEDTNATALLELRSCFKDDGGVDALTFTITYEQDSAKLEAELNADGHHVDFRTRTPNWWGEMGFRVRAADAGLLTAEASFTVKVIPVNDPPVLVSPGSLVATQGARFERTFTATDADLGTDPEEHLTFSTNSTYLTLEPDTGRASFTPCNSQVGTHFFNLTVTDHYGTTDTRDLTLRVDNQNDPPVIEQIPDRTATEDVPFLLQVNATDPDVTIGQDTLLFEDNTTLFNIGPANGTISFTPGNKDVGEHLVTVTVTDLAGLKARSEFVLTVLNVNDPPRLQPVADKSVLEDANLSFDVVASDEDAGDVLAFFDNSSLFDINAAGRISFRPAQKDVGVHLVNVTVMDTSGAIASVLFRITVVNVNDPPANLRIDRPFNGTAFKQGENVTFEGNATDEDGDALDYTWFLGAEELGTGRTFTTSALKPGAYVVTLTVSDGSLSATSAPITITVKKRPVVPAKGFIPGFTVLALLAAAAAGMLASLVSSRGTIMGSHPADPRRR